MVFAEILTVGNQSALKYNCFHELRFTEYLLWSQSPKFAQCDENNAGKKWGDSTLLPVM